MITLLVGLGHKKSHRLNYSPSNTPIIYLSVFIPKKTLNKIDHSLEFVHQCELGGNNMSPSIPDLAQDIIRIHKVITRALNVGMNKAIEHLQSGVTSPQALLGYRSYIHSLATVLGSHHQSEDLIIFPAFQKVLPLTPYSQLIAEHHQIETLLAPIPEQISVLSGDAPEGGLREIDTILQEIFNIWVPHIRIEEGNFTHAALNAVMNLEEQETVSQAIGKYSQEHSDPPYWIMPFVLFNLELDDRMSMAANFPPMIMDELIPKVWKEQWAPMKPYLLE